MASPHQFDSGPDGPPVGVFHAPPPSPPQYHPRWWLHVLLFVATLWSTSYLASLWWVGKPPFQPEYSSFWDFFFDPRIWALGFSPSFVAQGLIVSGPLLFILFVHEMGHYFAARRHQLLVTPPFFLPLPIILFPIGTLGAVIRIKEPIRNKRQLLDVGVAGPLAGFIATIPFLVFGIAHSEVVPDKGDFSGWLFADPLIVRALQWLVHGSIPEGSVVMMHPVYLAAWFGLLLTLVNLLPFAQFDGGHVWYALVGRLQRAVAWPLLAVPVILGFWWPGWWVFSVLAVVLGPQHPRIWDEDVPLDRKRRIIGWITVAIFVLCFMPAPIQISF